MKILLITSSFPKDSNCAALFLLDFIQELNRNGHYVHVLTQNCVESNRIQNTLWPGCEITYFRWDGGNIPVVDLFQIGMRGNRFALQLIKNAITEGYSIVRQWKPDFIHSEWILPGGLIAFGISLLSGIPYTTRSLGSDIELAQRNRWIAALCKRILRSAHGRFADGFELCKKTSILADNATCYFAPTSRKLNNGITNFQPLDDDGFFTTCTIGRLHPVKGHDVLIAAASFLKNKNILFRSYIVGSGKEHENLKNKIIKHGLQEHVILTGHLNDGDISVLLNHVDVVVIPSRNESIPLVLSEAIRSSRPLIVTDVGDMGIIVRKYEIGIVVESENPQALCESIWSMAHDTNRDKYLKQKEQVLSLLSVENAVHTILDTMKHSTKHKKS